MNSDLKTLETIVEYCTKIENATMRFGNNQKEFLSDIDYQHTCSFSITQIGEHVKRLSKEIREKTHETQWRKIAGMKDIITHAYGGIDLIKLWNVITEKIPELKETCNRLIREL